MKYLVIVIIVIIIMSSTNGSLKHSIYLLLLQFLSQTLEPIAVFPVLV